MAILLAIAIMSTNLLPSTVRASDDPIADFIDRAYELILDRKAEDAGFQYWYQNITAGSLTAADIVDQFFHTDEFTGRGINDEGQVEILYHVMFDREPDDGGKQYWLKYLDAGVSISGIINGFTQSPEFAEVCARYNMVPGTIPPVEGRDLNWNVTEFVSRAYDLLLERRPDVGGLNYWTKEIASGNIAANSLVNELVRSPEFSAKGLDDASVLALLYKAMFDRQIDDGGCQYWLGILDYGVSMSCIISMIGACPEFAEVCARYGMTTGSVKLEEPRDQNYQLTGYISRAIFGLTGRKATVDECNVYTDAILKGTKSIAVSLSEFASWAETSAHLPANEDFLKAAFDICYGAQDDAKMQTFLSSLNGGKTRSKVMMDITNDPAYKAKLTGLGLKDPMVEPKKMIALTFDDGPYSPVTNRILDVLEKYNAHATFFVVGNRVNSYSSCVKRAVSLGCEIGNHTWDHTSLTTLSGSEVASQISRCNNAVFNLTGVMPSVMRPVGGAYNATVSNNVGMPMIIWSVDTNDWKYRDSQHVINAILNNVKDGDIVLMHDLYASTAAAMETVIPELIARGYTLVTVSELAEYKNQQLKNGQAYTSIR